MARLCQATGREREMPGMLPTGLGPSSASFSSGRAGDRLQCVVAAVPDVPWPYWNTVYDNACRERHRLLGLHPMAHEIPYPAGWEITCWTRCQTVIEPRTGTAGRAA